MQPSTASAVLSQGMVEGQETMVASQMSFYPQPSLPHLIFPSIGLSHYSLGALNTSSVGGEAAFNLRGTLPPMHPKHRDLGLGQAGASSDQRSVAHQWPWVEEGEMGGKRQPAGTDHHNSSKNTGSSLSVAAVRMKKVKTRKKVREPRFCFKTLSEVDVLDDGYKWRKYGQKVVKNTQHPRSYYRCVQDNCRVKKRVERLAEDPRMVITTYEGRHAHSPSRDDEEQQASSHVSFFW